MDKIEKSQYDITLKDLRALQNFTDWCNFYDCFDMFTDSVTQDKIAYEKLKIRQCINKFEEIAEEDEAHKTMNITIDDLRYLDSVLGGDKIFKYFNLDSTIITSDHLTSKQLETIITALDESRKKYGDDGNSQLEVASLKFQLLYHKAKIDKILRTAN